MLLVGLSIIFDFLACFPASVGTKSQVWLLLRIYLGSSIPRTSSVSGLALRNTNLAGCCSLDYKSRIDLNAELYVRRKSLIIN